MNSLSEVLSKGRGLIPYLTYADPSPDASEQLMAACLEAGATALEVGLPFSDPIADGPVIQASHQRALQHKPKVADAIAMMGRLRQRFSKPVVAMSSVNLLYSYGIDAFFADLAKHGVDGVVIPDLPVEGAAAFLAAAKLHGRAIVFLVSPLCSSDRLKALVEASSGFVYLISSTGTTGKRDAVAQSLQQWVADIKAISSIPVAVGFGVSSASHVQDVWTIADAAIVGSFLVEGVADAISKSNGNVASGVDWLKSTVSQLLG